MTTYNDFFYELEDDVYLLESLIEEVKMFKEIYARDKEDPEATIINHENLEYAFKQYTDHKTDLLPKLDKWFEIVSNNEMTISIGYYKVREQLREQKAMGL